MPKRYRIFLTEFFNIFNLAEYNKAKRRLTSFKRASFCVFCGGANAAPSRAVYFLRNKIAAYFAKIGDGGGRRISQIAARKKAKDKEIVYG